MQLKRCLGVDIGATSIKVAEAVSEKTGVRITKLARAEVNLPPGPMNNERINAVSKAIRDLIKDQKITTKHAAFCVPGQSVFVRRIRVPRTTEERLHRIVTYEARQQIPFAVDNSLMEYQVFDWGDDPDVEVLLVAIKKDIVLDFMKILTKTGLTPVQISISSVAVYNFHVFDSTPFDEIMGQLGPGRGKGPAKQASDVKAVAAPETPEGQAAPAKPKAKFSLKLPKMSFGKKKPATEEEVAEADMSSLEDAELPPIEDVYEEVRAYINVGAQTFDLAIARLGKHKVAGFNRSVPWAGNELTKMLLDKMRMSSLADAERLKCERAIVILPGQEDDASKSGVDADASEFATAWADRLILDLRKSFDYYISQPDGMAVDSIVLSGGTSLLRNLPAYIEDKLGIPVEVKTQIENAALKLPDGVTPEEVAQYPIAIGLALSGLGYGQITVDFLPSDLKAIREFKKKNIEVFLLIGALVGMVGFSSQVGKRHIENWQAWLDQNKTRIETANQGKAQLDKARSENSAVDQKVSSLGQGISDRSYWLDFLAMIQSVKPANVLITSVSMSPDGQVMMVCETENMGSIPAFSGELAAQKNWIQSVRLLGTGTAFSRFVSKEVHQFVIQIQTASKVSRLAVARVTLPPGQVTPTPTPQATPSSFGGGKGPGGPAAPGMEQAI